jgi:hypothetical protein
MFARLANRSGVQGLHAHLCRYTFATRLLINGGGATIKNLAYMVAEGQCKDLSEAKDFLRKRCKVQFIVLQDDNDRKWAKHFILRVIQPRYSD